MSHRPEFQSGVEEGGGRGGGGADGAEAGEGGRGGRAPGAGAVRADDVGHLRCERPRALPLSLPRLAAPWPPPCEHPPRPSPPEGPSRVESEGGNVRWGDAHSKSSLGRQVGRSEGVTMRAGSVSRLAGPRSPEGVREVGPRACPVPSGRQPLALHWWGVLSDTGHATQERWGTCSGS